jgi:diguanylate cyclase
MSTSFPEFGLSTWLGEFQDAATERAFRLSNALTSARDLRVALWAWIVLLVIVTVYDLRVRGFIPGEFLLLGLRLGLIGGLLLLIERSRHNPEVAVAGYAVTLLELVGFATLFLPMFYRAEALISSIVATIMMLFAVFVLIPNRVLPAVFVATLAVAGAMICGMLRNFETGTQWVLFVSLVTPAALGYLAARRLHLTQRQQFALLRVSEEANIQLSAEIERRKVLESELKHQAMTDPLTGLFNRRHFEFLFKRERQRAMRLGNPLTLCLVDLDYFKSVNDQHGHEVGDKVLQAAARMFIKQLRQTDITGRIGGEEFVLMLPDTAAGEAHILINRLREALSEEPVKVGTLEVQITATFAVTEVDLDKDTFASALRSADKALYEGKDAGRNCVMLAARA